MLLSFNDVFVVYPAYLSGGSVFFVVVFFCFVLSCFFFLPVEVVCHLPRRLVHFVLLLVSRRSWNISPSRQPGVLLLLPLSVVRGSAVEPIVAGTCCRGS